MQRRRLAMVIILCCAALGAGCGGDPEAEKRRFFESGEAYFAEQKYPEAIVEYRNALQHDPRYGDARYRLAEAYARLNDRGNAMREYVRAADLLPERVDSQLKAGGYLLIAGKWEDARSRADRALQIDPRSVEAHILKGNALAGLSDLDTAVREIEEAIAIDPKATRAYISLGALQLYRHRHKEAEDAFLRAVAIDTRSVAAHLALSNYYWATGRPEETDRWLRRAVELDPSNVEANRAIAVFYMVSNRAPDAERHLKAIADTSSDPAARLALADYYLATNRAEEAVALLGGVDVKNKVAFSGARSRLASLEYARGNRDRAHQMLDETLQADASNSEILNLKSQLLLDENRVDEALRTATAAVAAARHSPANQYTLGLVHVARNELNEAIAAFGEVARLNPRAISAQLQLARAHLLRGGTQAALQFAEEAVRLQPRNAVARLILARTLMADRKLDRAKEILRAVTTEYPQWAPALAQLGTLHLIDRQTAAAEQAYAEALRIQPDLLEGVAGLVAIDVSAKRPDSARARVEQQLTQRPRDIGMLLLGARTYAATGDRMRTEQMLRRALDVDPSVLQAYTLLAELYIRQGRLDEARREFETVAARRPTSVAAHTMVGIILQTQKKTREARERYEKAITIDPHAAVAANNLAWMYAEDGGSLDAALALAQTAKGRLPDQPEVNDTLGWIYYRKNLGTLAIPPLRASVEKDPDNPLYQYHLGLAYAQTGDDIKARMALSRALALQSDFEGAEDARRMLEGPRE